MIIKIKIDDNGWAYFEAKEIYVTKIDWDKVHNNDLQWILQSERKEDKKIKLINLCSNGSVKDIGTNQICFLLNDEGKTIERLN